MIIMLSYSEVFLPASQTEPADHVIRGIVVNKMVKKLASLMNSDSPVAKRIRQRRDTITEVCRKYGLGQHNQPFSEAMFKHPPSPQYQVFYFDT
jgi:hypothetical protein